MGEREFATQFNTQLVRAVRGEPKREEAAQRLIDLHKRHGAVVQLVLRDQLSMHSKALLDGTLEPTSLLARIVAGEHLEPPWTRYCDRLHGLLQEGVPVACASHKPENEPHLQEICDGILRSNDVRLVREYPFMRWSSSLAKPDWYIEPLNVLVEAKYVRKKEDLRPISEALAADITKYGDNQYKVLFVIYDPHHLIVDEDAFAKPLEKRPGMRMRFVR